MRNLLTYKLAVKLGLVKSNRSNRTFFEPKISWAQKLSSPKFFVDPIFFGPKIYFNGRFFNPIFVGPKIHLRMELFLKSFAENSISSSLPDGSTTWHYLFYEMVVGGPTTMSNFLRLHPLQS